MAAGDQIVPRKKKFKKKITLIRWACGGGPQLWGVSDQIYGWYGQKNWVWLFSQPSGSKYTDQIWTAAAALPDIFLLKISSCTRTLCPKFPLESVPPNPMIFVPLKSLPEVVGTCAPHPVTLKSPSLPLLIGLRFHYYKSYLIVKLWKFFAYPLWYLSEVQNFATIQANFT